MPFQRTRMQAPVVEETDLPENDENQGLELVEAPRKTISEAISYARVAKKIDVIALKHALSNQIDAVKLGALCVSVR